MAQKNIMWSNVMHYLNTPRAALLIQDFRYALELAPPTATDAGALASVRLGASAILPGLCGVFLTQKITNTM